MKKLFIRFFSGLIVLTCTLCSQSCAPVFNELQSARLAGKGQVELTPHYSTASVAEEGNSESVQNQIGLQLAYGVTPKFDLRFRYENVWAKGGGVFDGISLIGFGPKISLVQDRVAFYAPIGTPIGEGVTDSWQFQPTLFLTLPVVPQKIDVTIAPKYIIPFCDECENYFAFNAGLSISSDVTKWALRPEYGLLFEDILSGGNNATASHFSLGLSFKVGGKK